MLKVAWLAQAPYIRESRRIAAEYTVVEQDLSVAVRGAKGAAMVMAMAAAEPGEELGGE